VTFGTKLSQVGPYDARNKFFPTIRHFQTILELLGFLHSPTGIHWAISLSTQLFMHTHLLIEWPPSWHLSHDIERRAPEKHALVQRVEQILKQYRQPFSIGVDIVAVAPLGATKQVKSCLGLSF